MKIAYCKRCVNPSTRPNMQFDAEGVCPVCRFAEKNRQGEIDWEARRGELEKITRWGTENSKTSYDCIVTVSGGKDSTRQALFVRDELGLKPLLVSSVYPPEHLHERGARNLSNLIELGFDTVCMSLNPQIWKKLMLQGFFKHANWCKSTEMALYAIPIHVAIAYKIPLIFLGENPAFTIGENQSGDTGDASRMKYCHTLEGGTPDRLMTGDIGQKDVIFYRYPSDEDMAHAKLRIVYLGYYIKDFFGSVNAKMAIEHGLEIRSDPPEKIGDIWGFTGLDEDFRIVNQMIKYAKFGYGHVTDQVGEAINLLGTMTREEGFELVRKYDGKCDEKFIRKYCDYLGINEEKFWEIVEAVRNKDIFERDENGEWRLKSDYK